MAPPDRGSMEAVTLVARRSDFLDCLTGATLDKRDLVDELGHSRSTVDRAVRDLGFAGLVRRTEGGYTTTLSGRLNVERYHRYVQSSLDVLALQDVIDVLPADAPLDTQLFWHATVHRADDTAPYDLIRVVRDPLEHAVRVRTLLPVLLDPSLIDVIHQRTVDDGVAVPTVVHPTLFERLRTHHADDFAPIAERGHIAVGAVPPFSLIIAEANGGDTEVLVVVHSERGAPNGVIQNDTREAVEWAETLYEEVRAEASPILDIDSPSV